MRGTSRACGPPMDLDDTGRGLDPETIAEFDARYGVKPSRGRKATRLPADWTPRKHRSWTNYMQGRSRAEKNGHVYRPRVRKPETPAVLHRRKRKQLYNTRSRGDAHRCWRILLMNAKQRRKSVGIDETYARTLFESDCRYCGSRGTNRLNGIDRVDSAVGYDVGNVVPSCTVCQYSKRNYSLQIFLAGAWSVSNRTVHPSLVHMNTRRRTFGSWKCSARRRGHAFEIVEAEFLRLVVQDCSYCTRPQCGGIDRADNDIGYVPTNCVPCCTICNMMKWKLGADEFVAHCRLITEHQRRLAAAEPAESTVQTDGTRI